MTVYRRPDPIPRAQGRVATELAPLPVRDDAQDLHRLITRQLFVAIASGRHAEGSILPNEDALGAEFGVSRTALREAVKALAAKGMVEPRRRRGTLVLPQSRWNLLDPEVIGWLRRSDGRTVSAELWHMVAAVLPSVAGLAAGRRAASALRVHPLVAGAAGTEPRAQFLIELARASGNRFLLSIVATGVLNLLRDDPGELDHRTGWLDRPVAAELVTLIGQGAVAEAAAALSRHTAPTPVVETA